MNSSNLHQRLKNQTLPFVFMILFLSILIGCESGNDLAGQTSSADTGSIYFNVVWTPKMDMNTDYQTKAVLCGIDPAQVAEVRATIGNTSTSAIRSGGPWPCEDSSGTIQGVPVGSGYAIFLYGYNGQDQPVYSGALTGISISAGDNNIGTIDANPFLTEITFPEDLSSNIDPDNPTFNWNYTTGAAEYQLWISENMTLTNSMIFTAATTNQSITLTAGNLQANKTYYWTVFPVDLNSVRSYFYYRIWSFTTGSGGAASDDNYEENDDVSAAYDLSWYDGDWLSDINGYGIAVADDDDWYAIYVDYGFEYLTIDCTFSHANGDIDIDLYDQWGSEVESQTSSDDNEQITKDLTSYGYGTYYIKVYLADGVSNTYDLRWDTTMP